MSKKRPPRKISKARTIAWLNAYVSHRVTGMSQEAASDAASADVWPYPKVRARYMKVRIAASPGAKPPLA